MTAALALALAGSGCSFLFSEGAPADHERMENFTCGESRTPPLLDTVATGLLAAGVAINAASADETIAKEPLQNQADRRREITVAIGVGSAFAVIGLASAVYGYHAAADCREARAARELALAQSRALALPPPYGVPPDGEAPPYWPPPPAAAPPVTPPPPAPPSP